MSSAIPIDTHVSRKNASQKYLDVLKYFIQNRGNVYICRHQSFIQVRTREETAKNTNRRETPH